MAAKSAPSRRTGSTTPTAHKTTSKRSSTNKSICHDVIEDSSPKTKGHDSVICDGVCNTWLHRGCAGLSKPDFKKLAASNEPFYCPHCSLAQHKNEIDALKAIIENLSSDLLSINSRLDDISITRNIPQPLHVPPHDIPSLPHLSKHRTSDSSAAVPPIRKSSSLTKSPPFNSKFNIIVHGIHERPQGTPRHIRLKDDFEDINSVLQNLNLNSQIQPCGRDCRRIGKYDVSKPRPRPIIVTLNSTIEVSSILARRRFVTPPVIIKADLTPAECKTESILIRERRKLIEDGYERRSIKMYNSSLYLNGKLHGSVVNTSYQLYPLLADLAPELDQLTVNHSPVVQDHSPEVQDHSPEIQDHSPEVLDHSQSSD